MSADRLFRYPGWSSASSKGTARVDGVGEANQAASCCTVMGPGKLPVSALLEKEISNGWVVRTEMSIEQARRHWHKGIAVGKLNVVHAEGKEPRLVLDSTVCGVNPKCNIPERISLPMASDVRLAFTPEDTHASFIGTSFDFKAAHKQIQVHPSEHGLLLFRFANALYHYRVCHFGARFSAYWWQRTGAFLLRLLHGVLSSHPHTAWLFADDLLAALRRPDAHQQLALMVIFFAAISAPISWKKVQFRAAGQSTSA